MMALLTIFAMLLAPAAVFALIGYWKGRIVDQVDTPSDFNLKTQFSVQAILLFFIVITGLSVFFAIYEGGFQLTGAMFVGLPAIIAVLVVLTGKFQSPFRALFLAIAALVVILLLTGSEGAVCLIIAMPIFCLIGFFTILASRWAFKKSNGYTGKILFVLIFTGLSLEGVAPGYQFNKNYTVTRSELIELPMSQVRSNLAHNPDFDALPMQLGYWLGLPVPTSAIGTGLQEGIQRNFVFKHQNGTQRLVTFEVIEATENSARLALLSDDTLIGRWLGWQETEFKLTPVSENSTRMDVAMSFERRVSPAWYFGPLQSFLVYQAERVLIAHGRQSIPVDNKINISLLYQ